MNFIEVCKQNKPFKVKGARSPGQYYVKPRTRTLCHFICLDKSDERELNSNSILNLMNHDEFELVEPKIVPLSEKERDADCCDEDAPIFQKKDVKEVLKNTVKELRICNNAMDIKTFVEIIFEKHFGSDLL